MPKTSHAAPFKDADLVLDWLLKPQNVDADRLAVLTDDGWSHLLDRTRQHRVWPMLAWNAQHLPTDSLTDRLLSDLAGARQKSAVRQLAVARECVLIHDLLNREHVPHMFLKGAYLAQACYPEPGLRPMRDIDILVPRASVAQAWHLLRSHGGSLPQYAQLGPDAAINPKHLPALKSPSGIIQVEVHHSIQGGEEIEAFESHLERMWSRRASFDIAGKALPCPIPEDMFLHLVLHGLNDHHLNIGPLFATDLQQLCKAVALDWDLIRSEAEAVGLIRATALSLALAGISDSGSRFGDPPAGDIVAAARRLTLQDAKDQSTILFASSKPRRRLSDWIHLARKIVLPTRSELLAWQASQPGRDGPNVKIWWRRFVEILHRAYLLKTDREIKRMESDQKAIDAWVGFKRG